VESLQVGAVSSSVTAAPGREICGVVGIINLPLTQYLIVITEKQEMGT